MQSLLNRVISSVGSEHLPYKPYLSIFSDNKGEKFGFQSLMMVSLKLVLDRRRIRKNGTYPLSIRVSNNRQSIYYNWGLTLHPQDYDSKLSRVKRCHSFSSQINIECEQKMKQVERLIDRLWIIRSPLCHFFR